MKKTLISHDFFPFSTDSLRGETVYWYRCLIRTYGMGPCFAPRSRLARVFHRVAGSFSVAMGNFGRMPGMVIGLLPFNHGRRNVS